MKTKYILLWLTIVLSSYMLLFHFHERKVDVCYRHIKSLKISKDYLENDFINSIVSEKLPSLEIFDSEGTLGTWENYLKNRKMIFYISPGQCSSCLIDAVKVIKEQKDSILFIALVESVTTLKILEMEYETKVYGITMLDAYHKMINIKPPCLIFLSQEKNVKMVFSVEAYNLSILNKIINLNTANTHSKILHTHVGDHMK
jgi:hypothetical protein